MYEIINGIIGSEILAYIIGAAFPLIFVLIFVIFAVLAERKVSAHMQDRLGPMRVGYHGLLQTIADLIKLLQKEDIISDAADKKWFNFAPMLVFLGSYAAFAVIPFSSIYIGSNADVGIFYLMAISSLVVAGILIAGWSSNNKYSQYGSFRSVAQIVSYEIPTAVVILSIVMITGTLSLGKMSDMQTAYFWNWLILGGPEWDIAKLLLIPFVVIAFLIFFISTLAEANRIPFDLPESESELVAGFNTEYSGMKFAFFFLSEFANMFLISAIIVTIFFGGYQSPVGYLGNTLGLDWLVPIEQFIWFTLKGLTFVFIHMWIRWTLPRVRIDQLMTICWKYLIPYSIANLIIIGLITLI